MIDTKTITALSAVTATTTSNSFYVGGAKRIGFQLTRADHSAGSSTFTFGGSLDSQDTTTPTMTALNMLITNTANTNGQTLIRVASIALSSNTTSIVWLSPECALNWVNVTVTEVTDGTHTAKILVEY